MSHQELVERMRSSKGTIFSCHFVKRSTGELRRMVCRLGVQSHLKGGTHAYDPLEHGLLAVFDMRKKEYRSIALEGIRQLKIRGITYTLSEG